MTHRHASGIRKQDENLALVLGGRCDLLIVKGFDIRSHAAIHDFQTAYRQRQSEQLVQRASRFVKGVLDDHSLSPRLQQIRELAVWESQALINPSQFDFLFGSQGIDRPFDEQLAEDGPESPRRSLDSHQVRGVASLDNWPCIGEFLANHDIDGGLQNTQTQ